VLTKASRETIALALKGASESLQQKFFSCMTQRAADQTRFEMDNNAAPRVADIQDKQREMVNIARSLEQQKIIDLDKNSLRSGQG